MRQKGFTLLELLVVMAIIGILAGVVVLTSIQGTARARDARRIQELYQIAHALLQYYTVYEYYPENTDTNDLNCSFHGVDWDAGNIANEQDVFIRPLVEEGFLDYTPREWTDVKDAWDSDCIYRYNKITSPCDGKCEGTYAILYAACESSYCPVNERPSCCNGSSWEEGTGANDSKDVIIFLKER